MQTSLERVPAAVDVAFGPSRQGWGKQDSNHNPVQTKDGKG